MRKIVFLFLHLELLAYQIMPCSYQATNKKNVRILISLLTWIWIDNDDSVLAERPKESNSVNSIWNAQLIKTFKPISFRIE